MASLIYQYLLTVTIFNLIYCHPDVGAGWFTVLSPATLTSDMCEDEVEIDFKLELCMISGDETAQVTKVTLYYTDNEDFEHKTIVSAGAEVILSETVSPGEKTLIRGGTPLAGDLANCGSYTHLCAVVTAVDDARLEDDDSCIRIDGGTESTTNCRDIALEKLILTDPNPVISGFELDRPTSATFDVQYSIEGFVTPSRIQLFFSGVNYTVKSTKATARGGNAPDGQTTFVSSGSFSDITASVTLDADNCEQYTRLCAEIEVEDSVHANNMVCAIFGAGPNEAGEKPSCSAAEVTSISMYTPSAPMNDGAAVLTMSAMTVILAFFIWFGFCQE
ncbi:uncharacterized protein [Ptychodera flava]|uniref:uncharacterized protein isoform X1 n=1 Tax=Ptychodera flava TaxID=63121 RepID=UPI00396A26F9